MALDWSKQISFSGLKKPSAKAKETYPEKTYMNLVVQDKKQTDIRSTVPKGILVVLVVILFLKFGVFDLYAQVNAKQAEVSIHRGVLNALTADIANYDKLVAEYEGYESLSISEDALVVDARDALDMVDRVVTPYAHVVSLVLSGDTMELSLSNITLDGVGQLTSVLNEQDIVAGVSVTNASNKQTSGNDVITTMTITLQPAPEISESSKASATAESSSASSASSASGASGNAQ